METIPLHNYSLKSTRREQLNGRWYRVAPATILREGVLNGSQGPLFYPADEISRDPQAWNGMPITVNHPTEGGMPASARRPAILERFGIGTVFSAVYNGRLRTELWFDEELTQSKAPTVWENLLAGRPNELSTGLFTSNSPSQGSHQGRPYTHVARNYRPDHLAVLTNEPGACSVADGCGVNVNAESPGGPNCGTGAGGFKPGNTCGAGKGGGSGLSASESQDIKDWQFNKEFKSGYWQVKPSSKYDELRGSDEFVKTVGKLPKFEGTVHRGTVEPSAKVDSMRVGQELELPQSVATTASGEFKAIQYANQAFTPASSKLADAQPTVYVLKGASGGDLHAHGTSSKDTHEVIVPKGQKYRIKEIQRGVRLGGESLGIQGGNRIVLERIVTNNAEGSMKGSTGPNCGTGAGGFKAGNQCGAGGGLKSITTNADKPPTGTVECPECGGKMKKGKKCRCGHKPTPETTETETTNAQDQFHDHNQPGDDQMKLTPEQRKEHVSYLTANCDCWKKQGDDAILNGLPDGKLADLRAGTEKAVQNQRTLTANAAKAAADKIAADEAERRSKETQVQNSQTPKTAKEWLAEAPPEIQSAVQNAMRIDLRERQVLANRLVANVADEGRRKEKFASLVKKDLAELRDLVELIPVTANSRTEEDVLAGYDNSHLSLSGFAPDVPLGNAAPKHDGEKEALLPFTVNSEDDGDPIRKRLRAMVG